MTVGIDEAREQRMLTQFHDTGGFSGEFEDIFSTANTDDPVTGNSYRFCGGLSLVDRDDSAGNDQVYSPCVVCAQGDEAQDQAGEEGLMHEGVLNKPQAEIIGKKRAAGAALFHLFD